ncbi:MAG: histidinol dehydrogenase [Actinomycetota bacterium]|nr:histidinol dehydrogenase [Actinomycetota bacterium]
MIEIEELAPDISEEEMAVTLPKRSLDESKTELVQRIIDKVRSKGDSALRGFAAQFDGADLKGIPLAIQAEEFREARGMAGKDFVQAINLAKERIWRYHEKQIQESWFDKSEAGVLLGQKVSPIGRVGIYVPGGTAAYPSSVLMNALPAQVAGVNEIAMCVPCDENGRVNPYTLTAAAEIGVKEVYRVGGAGAIAALAYGTESIKRVDKITGPGNIYVTLAKKLVFGVVDIDMLAGPSEIVIIADEGSNAKYIAADMLGQAEHDQDAMAVLITTSRKLAEDVLAELELQLESLARGDVAKEALKRWARIFLVKRLDEALRMANLIAPEHLEIMTAKPEALLADVRNAGAVFLGEYTPEALGDYAAGSNHILPTMGTAAFSSPLGVHDFVKRTSVLSFDQKEFKRLAPAVEILAEAEGLSAHSKSISVRMMDVE